MLWLHRKMDVESFGYINNMWMLKKRKKKKIYDFVN